MNGFANVDSKEIKIRELNGRLRKSVYIILGLVAFGTIVGLMYWRLSDLKTIQGEQNRQTAVNIIVKAMAYYDSLASVRHNEIMNELKKTHKDGVFARPADTTILRRELEKVQEAK